MSVHRLEGGKSGTIDLLTDKLFMIFINVLSIINLVSLLIKFIFDNGYNV